MGTTLWLSPLLTGRNLIRALMSKHIQLPERIWHRLNFAWVAFFAMMGLLNLWVAYSFSTDTWVNFKLFGGMGLMLAFALVQGIYVSRHVIEDTAPETNATPPTKG
jgi:intracellular septation protein